MYNIDITIQKIINTDTTTTQDYKNINPNYNVTKLQSA